MELVHAEDGPPLAEGRCLAPAPPPPAWTARTTPSSAAEKASSGGRVPVDTTLSFGATFLPLGLATAESLATEAGVAGSGRLGLWGGEAIAISSKTLERPWRARQETALAARTVERREALSTFGAAKVTVERCPHGGPRSTPFVLLWPPVGPLRNLRPGKFFT